MKTLTQKITKTLTVIVLTLSTISVANAASKVVAADDYITSKICVAAVGESKIQLRNVIEDSGLNKRFVVKNITCNDQNILEFVQEYGEKPKKMVNVLTNGKYNANVNITDLAAN
jgi:hypothetical protein